MTCRKRRDGVKTRGESLPWDKSGGEPAYCPDGTGQKGGVTLLRASVGNVGSCRPDAKGEIQVGGPHEDESTDAGHRLGATRSRADGSVIGPDRRGCVIRPVRG